MNEWSDAEISRRLALAIGWEESKVSLRVSAGQCMVNWDGRIWRHFDYTDCRVIWPIAERFNAFPEKAWGARRWAVERWEPVCQYTETDTAAKAVALAVIKAKEQT